MMRKLGRDPAPSAAATEGHHGARLRCVNSSRSPSPESATSNRMPTTCLVGGSGPPSSPFLSKSVVLHANGIVPGGKDRHALVLPSTTTQPNPQDPAAGHAQEEGRVGREGKEAAAAVERRLAWTTEHTRSCEKKQEEEEDGEERKKRKQLQETLESLEEEEEEQCEQAKKRQRVEPRDLGLSQLDGFVVLEKFDLLHEARLRYHPQLKKRVQQQQQQPPHASLVNRFELLPEEVQLQIFTFVPIARVLDTLPLVCRNWLHLTMDESLWRALHALHFGGAKAAELTWKGECVALMRQMLGMRNETLCKINQLSEEFRAHVLKQEHRCYQQIFSWACKNGQIRQVEELYFKHSSTLNINHFFISDQYQRTPLMAAVEGGHIEVVKFLIHHKAWVNAATLSGWNALMLGANKGRTECVKLLLANGANVNATTSSGCTALMFAAEKGYPEIVDLLLSHSALANVSSSKGWTALIIAASKGHDKVASSLLAYHADVKATTHDGLTALMTAAYKGRESLVRLLLKVGADVNATAEWGVTALMGAADKGRAKIVEMLLEYGADVNATTEDGWTALMGAADNGHTCIVQLLLSHNANVHAVRRNGETAYIVAKDGGHTEVLRLLQDKLHKETTLESGSS